MAIAIGMTEPAAVADRADEPLVTRAIEEQEQEQEAAEFIARQVLDRGATFFE